MSSSRSTTPEVLSPGVGAQVTHDMLRIKYIIYVHYTYCNCTNCTYSSLENSDKIEQNGMITIEQS